MPICASRTGIHGYKNEKAPTTEPCVTTTDPSSPQSPTDNFTALAPLVLPEGFEPPQAVPKTAVLSITPRERTKFKV